MLRHKIRPGAILIAAAFIVSACGTVPSDRAASGGGIGLATGAVIGVLTGGVSVLAGALIGGTVGAVGGAVTTPEQVNLGEPIWKRWFGPSQESDAGAQTGEAAGSAARLTDTNALSQPMVQGIQRGLAKLGYDPGVTDGRIGPRTRLAIQRYQQDNKLLVDRRASPELLRHIETRIGDG